MLSGHYDGGGGDASGAAGGAGDGLVLLRYSFLYIVLRVRSRLSQFMFAVCYVLVKIKFLLVPYRPLAHAARSATFFWVALLQGASNCCGKIKRIRGGCVVHRCQLVHLGCSPLGQNTAAVLRTGQNNDGGVDI